MTSQLLGSKLSREARAGFAPCSEGTVRKMQLSRQNVGLIPHPGRQELLPPECPPAALQWLQTRSSIRNPMLSQDIAEDAALELTTAKCHSPAGATMSWPDSSSASLAWPPRLQKRGAAPSIQARDFSSSLGTFLNMVWPRSIGLTAQSEDQKRSMPLARSPLMAKGASRWACETGVGWLKWGCSSRLLDAGGLARGRSFRQAPKLLADVDEFGSGKHSNWLQVCLPSYSEMGVGEVCWCFQG